MAGNENSGRKPNSEYAAMAKLRLHAHLGEAVSYLISCVDGTCRRANPNRVIAAKEVIHQCIGKPTQRIEAEGSVSPELMELLGELAQIHRGEMPIHVVPSKEEKQLEAWERKERGDFGGAQG